MRHELRYYQSDACERVFDMWGTGMQRLLVAMATGTGKTTFVAAVAERVVQQGGRFMFVAHTSELIEQGKSEIEEYTGLPVAVEQAERTAHGSEARITMASVQSISQLRRMKRFSPDHYDVVCCDEAHRSPAASYRRVFNYFTGAKGLGVSATPQRSDKLALSTVFEAIAYEYSLTQAIKDGNLCDIVAQQIPVSVDLSKLRMRRGDFDLDEVDEAVNPHLEAIADEVVKYRGDRAGIAFLPLVATSKRFSAMLVERGIKSAAVWGLDPDRDAKIAALKDGSLDFLCNSNLLVEGFNCPRIGMIVPCVPTKSATRYKQQVGRGTRLFEGKDHLLILDPLWLASKYRACTPATLFGEVQDVTDIAEAERQKQGGRGNVMQSVTDAQVEFARQREAKITEEMERNKYKRARQINPIDFAAMIHDGDLMRHEDVFGWEQRPATPAQKRVLCESFKVDGMTQGQASKLIDKLKQRRADGMATPKQVRQLYRLQIPNADKYELKEAGRILDTSHEMGWGSFRTIHLAKRRGQLVH